MKKMKIAVMAGGRSSEHEVSLMSAKEVMGNLDRKKYEIKEIIVGCRKGDIDFVEKLKEFKPDVVFIAMHGNFGEDGRLQGVLDFMGMPYIGSGVTASAIGMNKIIFKKLIIEAGFKTPGWEVVRKNDEVKLKLPLVVKPAEGGSSVGVSIARNEAELKKAMDDVFEWGEEALIEEYIEGKEVTCGVLGNREGAALPIVEIIPKNVFFDYEAKYVAGLSEEIVPARIDKNLTDKIQKMSVEIFQLCGCRGMARVDYIIRDDEIYVLEINTIPGLTANSLLPKEAKALGISYGELLDKVIELARE
ncbi:MAG TPA: D-alanine--D-alanine ligase [Patescibacteria group bacterium]